MERGALSDIRVVEYGDFISAPFAAKLFADAGADVVKVEAPYLGDKARRSGPFFKDAPDLERSGLFLYLNTNKQSFTLDLKKPLGARIFKGLIREADILIENQPIDTMKSLGLDYTTLREVNPRLIMTSITPFGQSGPYRNWKASDLIITHMSPLAYSTPYVVEDPERYSPIKPAGHQADFAAGLTAAVMSLVAFHDRRHTGQGQHLDLAAYEAVVATFASFLTTYSYNKEVLPRAKALNPRGGGFGSGGLFPCQDGWIQLHCGMDHQWHNFVKVMGLPAWALDERFGERSSRAMHWDLVEPHITKWTSQHTMEEVYSACQKNHVPCLPCNDTAQLLESEQFRVREFFVQFDHPETGPLTYPGVAFQKSRVPSEERRPAPVLGQHNEEVLCGRLGYSRETLIKLREAEVI